MINDFANHTLRFYHDRIVDLDANETVMMEWESMLMREHARVACHNRGDVLEIGFGMGLSARHIQSFYPRSHTIVECHQQILMRLYHWIAHNNVKNVRVIEGKWYEKRAELSIYDGIFFDTFRDKSAPQFADCAQDLIKPGGKITFWNSTGRPENLYNFKAIYHKIPINPPANTYYNETSYFLPEVNA
tara:strand:+ start:1371 stop:1934 length:564 start_codon:yes stop_codon:yes gene_type:complete